MATNWLDELEALHAKATPGPLTVERVKNATGETLYQVHSFFVASGHVAGGSWYTPGDHTTDLIAAAYSALPRLLAIARAAEKLIDDSGVGCGCCQSRMFGRNWDALDAALADPEEKP